MLEVYKKIRDDLVNKIYEKNISLIDIANDLDMEVEELVKYLRLEKQDYLVYKKIYKSIEKK